jgi:hypothetical protein
MAMRKLVWGGALVACVVPALARAQFGAVVGAGGTFRGQMSNSLAYSGLGYNVLGGLTYRTPGLPIALRLDVQYDEFSSPISVVPERIYSATMNAQYALPVGLGVVRPYLVGGGGYYHLDALTFNPAQGPQAPGEVDRPFQGLGVNGGAGVRTGFGRVGFFAEWRYHYVFAAGPHTPSNYTTYAPFTIGMTF